MKRLLWLWLAAVLAWSTTNSVAEEPLHQQIDRLIAARFSGESAPLADDAEFFRRVHLDLAGCIPPAAETRQFLADQSPDKRQAVIDRLLNSPGYVERMTNLFHVLLMERRGDNPDWEKFLRGCFEQNKPWDQIAREILRPDREQEALRGAAYFYTKRLEKVGEEPTDYPGLTRDVGRLFLGIDLQCAECHDHLFIDDYKQQDFQGLFAVYRNLSIRSEKFPAINEKAMTAKLDFVSVFDPTPRNTGPRIPFGKEFDVPQPPPADPKKRPDPNAPPSFSGLSLIAAELPSAENELFRRNIANRLWFVMMGQGLVEPLDQFHSANQATHPELLELLARELAARQFDIKWLIRELALSQTWQRSSRWPANSPLPPPTSYQLAGQRRLTAEQLFLSTLQATGNLQRFTPADGSAPSKEYTELKAQFVLAFAGEPKEPETGYTPAVKQALFLLNDSRVLGLLKPQSGNLLDRLSSLPDDQVSEELYLNLYCRQPDAEERSFIAGYLKEHQSRRAAALSRLAWAMLTSMEFCVNH